MYYRSGIHPNKAIEVQLIKISSFEKRAKCTRMHFIYGSRAVSGCFLKDTQIENMCNIMKCNESDLLSKVETLGSEFNKVVAEKNALKAQVAEYEVQNMLNSCENINNIKVLKTIYNNVDLKYVTLLGTKLVSHPKAIVLFGVTSEDKAQLLFMCSKDLNIISMNYLLKDAITLIDGKGGGKNNNNLDSSMEYAYNKVKASIMSNS
ncbi:alanyl-tRNA synthetase [Clostridium liquoris]|jgi:alanyl-tRNA synthetase|uniref:Alanyl-tRNA synthetase n=1 Tax=Clostridium liquoris TaxID=1289519 RepID=A0A2T0B276_9CLOT|nr:DHHA1 domain-containing protein [Clostridium liquoris]PRR77966.1 alanyl-tRNA synthetase [Clostridium liquoris]